MNLFQERVITELFRKQSLKIKNMEPMAVSQSNQMEKPRKEKVGALNLLQCKCPRCRKGNMFIDPKLPGYSSALPSHLSPLQKIKMQRFGLSITSCKVQHMY